MSSFANTPVTRLLVLGVVSTSIAASLLDAKHYSFIIVDTHLWRYRQFWRLLTYQICYTNSSEVLFAAMSFYNLRIVERMWGSRKYASYLLVSSVITALVPPLLLTVLRPLSPSLFNYMPAGPTPLLFAALAQFHAMVPHMYKYRVATSSAPSTAESFSGVTFSDKSYKYALAIHLALLQWPGSVIGALVGWVVGYAWREGLMPASLISWRLPGWMVGLSHQRRSAEFEGLRRRLEGENATAGVSTGVQGQADNQAERRRTMGQQIICVASLPLPQKPHVQLTKPPDSTFSLPAVFLGGFALLVAAPGFDLAVPCKSPLYHDPAEAHRNYPDISAETHFPLQSLDNALTTYEPATMTGAFANMDGYGMGRMNMNPPAPLDSKALPPPPPPAPASQGKALLEAYRMDIMNGFEGEAPRFNPLNTDRPQSSALVDLKDPIQVHLLTETALTDSKQYEILSQEEVDGLKKQCQQLNQRIEATRSNLSIQSKYRDAAISMAKLYSPGKGDSRRKSLLSNRLSGDQKIKEAEIERQTSERKCEELAAELFNLEKRLMEPHRRLLEHTAGILQLTHKEAKKKLPPLQAQMNGGVPGSPESLYTYSQGRGSIDFSPEDMGIYFFDEFRPPKTPAIEIPPRSPVREQQSQLREDMDRMRDENEQLKRQADDLARSLSDMEQSLERLNGTLRETIVSFNPNENSRYEEPPQAYGGPDAYPGDTLRRQLDYLESGLSAIQAEQSAMTGNNSSEAVLVSLWGIMQSELTDIKQRKQDRRRARMEKGLEDDEDMSDSDDMDTSEKYSLDGFASRVQWLWRQTLTLKDQKAVLKRQIKQQRELNNKSDAEKDNEIREKQVELEQSRALLDRAEKDAMDAQKMLSQTLEDLEKVRAEAGEAYSAQAVVKERGAKVEVLEAKLKEMQGNLASAEADSRNTTEKLAQFDQALANLSSQLGEATRQKSAAEADVVNVRKQLEEATRQRSIVEADVTNLRRQLEEATRSQSTAEAGVTDVRKQLEEAGTAKQAAESRAAGLQARLDEIQAEFSIKEASLKQKEEELDLLNMTMVDIKTELTFARAELDGAYGSRAERAKDAAAAKNSGEVANLQTQVSRLKQELADTIKELEDITKETIGAEREKLDLESKLDDALSLKASLESRLSEAMENRNNFEGELAILRERAEGEAQRSREKIARLEEELDTERLKAVPGQGGASRPGAGASMLSEQFRATMREERKKFQEDIKEERSRVRKLEEELNKLKRAQGPGKSPLSPRKP
ncbi:DSC E3 ubiquitin ligase complex subunit 2 [Paramyrothecium foliicola]|nr:DSC E3 ubiquitin ligase complex subunit 2 [Paramyrothecium foliicola]